MMEQLTLSVNENIITSYSNVPNVYIVVTTRRIVKVDQSLVEHKVSTIFWFKRQAED